MNREPALFEGVSRQRFFEALCWDHRPAARSALDGFARDPDRAVRFVGSVLGEVFSDFDLSDSYLRPVKGRHPELKQPAISICRIAIMYFCELLHESPAFVEALCLEMERTHGVPRHNLLSDREGNGFSMTRGFDWSAPGFADPEPIPVEKKEAYRRWREASFARDAERRAVEEETRRRELEEKRYRAFVRDLERRRAASERAAFWKRVGGLPLVERLTHLASDPDRLPKHYPLDPCLITPEVLERCGPEIARNLAAKLEPLWGERWKAARERIDAFLRGTVVAEAPRRMARRVRAAPRPRDPFPRVPTLEELLLGSLSKIGKPLSDEEWVALYRLYEAYVAITEEERRHALLESIAGRIRGRDLPIEALLPSIWAEPVLWLVSTAAQEIALLAEPPDDDPLFGTESVIEMTLRDSYDPARRGAMLRGPLLLGDLRVVQLVEKARRSISEEAQLTLVRVGTSYQKHGVVEFLLNFAEEDPAAAVFDEIAKSLVRIRTMAESVLDIRWKFPTWAPGPEPEHVILQEWTPGEYAARILPRLRAIAARRPESEAFGSALEAWERR